MRNLFPLSEVGSVVKPLGFDHRHERSPRGLLAAWWYRRRVRRVRAALVEIRAIEMRAALDRYNAEHPVHERP